MRCAICSDAATTFVRREPDGRITNALCATHGQRFLWLMQGVLHDNAYRYVALGTPETPLAPQQEVA